jgi:protein involved in polysaccharide export with SLBB domain
MSPAMNLFSRLAAVRSRLSELRCGHAIAREMAECPDPDVAAAARPGKAGAQAFGIALAQRAARAGRDAGRIPAEWMGRVEQTAWPDRGKVSGGGGARRLPLSRSAAASGCVGRLAAIAVVLASASACENQYPPERIPPIASASANDQAAGGTSPQAFVPTYRIGPGDELLVNSFYHSELKQPVTVQTDGRVSLLLVGSVMAGHKTPQQLSEELTRSYSRFLENADVTVTLDTSASLAVYVGGEVSKPSIVPIKGELSLLQSIAEAGGFRDTANRQQVLILRQTSDGKFRTFQKNAIEVLQNETPELYLAQHDVVYVPKSAIAQVDQFVDQYINQIIPHAVNGVFSLQDSIGGGGGGSATIVTH